MDLHGSESYIANSQRRVSNHQKYVANHSGCVVNHQGCVANHQKVVFFVTWFLMFSNSGICVNTMCGILCVSPWFGWLRWKKKEILFYPWLDYLRNWSKLLFLSQISMSSAVFLFFFLSFLNISLPSVFCCCFLRPFSRAGHD